MISAIAALKSSNDNGVFNGTNNDLPSSAQKVIVQLKATADTPILKQNKFKTPGTDIFAKVIDFLWRQIHRETVFVYMSSAFSPNPDELVIDLLNNFGVDVNCWSIMLVPWHGLIVTQGYDVFALLIMNTLSVAGFFF